ncbi:Trk system potassium transporter TrkA [Vermiculatibacterium agrestimuris]|uniref:Trk system potassium transporter TrkA n=1 Tax=Vermiculatibacterium agrestimuris TaxID=2941519 RepID=UPI00203AF91A|nr:Trk system potassium transporter TrkA [Vermiculatibacterium agrestimuris]
MNIIIVGDGKVGAALAAQLSTEGHDVTIIDSNPLVLSQSAEQFDVMAVTGNGASMATLREAGVERAEVLIAATSRDELNLLTCLTAKKLGAKHTIARIRNPEYSDQLIAMREELGLSLTVNPEQAAAHEAYQLLQFPSFLKRESFTRGRVEIVAIPVDEHSKLDGIPLTKLYDIARVNVLVCAVEREDGIHIPGGSFVLHAGDTLFVTAALQDLALLVKNLGLVEHKVKSLLIIGGSRIAFYLAKRCLDSGIAVKIIERDHERCVKLVESLPRATVIEGDGSRQDVLDAEGLRSFDAVITLTGMDEENLVLSMLASHLGVGKVITKINRIEYYDVFRKVGIGSVISPKGLCCANIVRYVRAMSSAAGIDSVISLHSIIDGQVEALEFLVGSETRHQREKLMDIPLKSGILIACITHQGRTIIPKGDSSFTAGDTMIVVTAEGRIINDLDAIFAD